MDDRENIKQNPSTARKRSVADLPDPSITPAGSTGSFSAANEELLSGTGSIPLVASSQTAVARVAQGESSDASDAAFSTASAPAAPRASAPAAPRYVRKRMPHRSQGTVDDIPDDSLEATTYTHDSNISVGGATPLSGMAYRRSRSNMSKVKNGSRYGQYLEIPKGRRTLFASRERQRRRRSVLALLAVTSLLVMAAMALWTLMQRVLG